MIELPDGQKMECPFRPASAAVAGPATDHFWTSVWIVPENYPSGTFVYKVSATDLQGQTHTWEPFQTATSQFQVVAGMIEIKIRN